MSMPRRLDPELAAPCAAWHHATSGGINLDQRAHPCKKLRFESIGQGESRKINGLCSRRVKIIMRPHGGST
jgi:hypothetical protein